MRRFLMAAMLVGSTSHCGGCNSDITYYTPPGERPIDGPHSGGRDGGEPFLFPADFGPIAEASPAPKPISGGTLAIDDDRDLIAVGDPDRDLVHIVDANEGTLLHTVTLVSGDDPGRAVFVPGGDLFVALRGAGVLLSIDLADGAQKLRLPVCPAPRGLAYDEAEGLLLLVCVGGELLRIDPTGARPLTSTFVATDLRDVVVENGRTWVSRFRAAEILRIHAEGAPTVFRPNPATVFGPPMDPVVAWRMVPASLGGVLVLHQYASTQEIDITAPTGAYGGDRGGQPPTGAGMTHVEPSGVVKGTGLIFDAAMSVDLVEIADVGRVYVARPGAHRRADSVLELWADLNVESFGSSLSGGVYPSGLQAISVAARANGELVSFSRQPARLGIGERFVDLPGDSVAHTGHEMFHRVQQAGIACASCHPEGRDDAHVWHFSTIGARRTQSSRGLTGTAPFHWDGDMSDLNHLLNEVMARRMGAGEVDSQQAGLMARWLDTLQPLRVRLPSDTVAIERGRVLFEAVGCTACHVGPNLTNNATVDVGTGGAFQVPSLRGLASRAPYMHSGCAETLHQRFERGCGGGDAHGVTSGLDAAQIDDLVTYLKTL